MATLKSRNYVGWDTARKALGDFGVSGEAGCHARLGRCHGHDGSVRVWTGADPRTVHRVLGNIPLVNTRKLTPCLIVLWGGCGE